MTMGGFAAPAEYLREQIQKVTRQPGEREVEFFITRIGGTQEAASLSVPEDAQLVGTHLHDSGEVVAVFFRANRSAAEQEDFDNYIREMSEQLQQVEAQGIEQEDEFDVLAALEDASDNDS